MLNAKLKITHKKKVSKKNACCHVQGSRPWQALSGSFDNISTNKKYMTYIFLLLNQFEEKNNVLITSPPSNCIGVIWKYFCYQIYLRSCATYTLNVYNYEWNMVFIWLMFGVPTHEICHCIECVVLSIEWLSRHNRTIKLICTHFFIRNYLSVQPWKFLKKSVLRALKVSWEFLNKPKGIHT